MVQKLGNLIWFNAEAIQLIVIFLAVLAAILHSKIDQLLDLSWPLSFKCWNKKKKQGNSPLTASILLILSNITCYYYVVIKTPFKRNSELIIAQSNCQYYFYCVCKFVYNTVHIKISNKLVYGKKYYPYIKGCCCFPYFKIWLIQHTPCIHINAIDIHLLKKTYA